MSNASMWAKSAAAGGAIVGVAWALVKNATVPLLLLAAAEHADIGLPREVILMMGLVLFIAALVVLVHGFLWWLDREVDA